MNTKKIICLVPLIGILGCGRTQGYEPPQWKVTAKVIDEHNQPITNANVRIWWHIPPPEGQSIAMTNISGLTDSNGVIVVNQRSGSIEVICEATKGGHYGSGRTHEFHKFKDGDPAKWNPTITLMLKKIVNPIPMYAKLVDAPPPVQNQPIGYDLMAGDWGAPHGKGSSTDMIFNLQIEKRAENDSDYKLTVSFPRPGDGIQSFLVPEAEKGSALQSPHQAPAEGYQPEWVQTRTRRPGQPTISNRDRSRNYFFRVRTVLDEQGNVKSALYGKIYGDFMQFRYYLNPTPNDRNVEFDPKQNLMQGLKSYERVDAP